MLGDHVFCDLIFIGAIIVSVVYIYFKFSHTYWKRLGVPYIEPQFPYGNGYDTLTGNKHVGLVMADNYRHFKSKGYKYGGTYFITNPSLLVVCPNLVKSILAKDFSSFSDRGFYCDEENDPLSAHLFALDGQKWKTLRTKLSPTFTSGKLRKMFDTLVDCSLELGCCLDEPIRKGEPIDIRQILIKFTMDVIGSCAFGIECNSFKNTSTEFITTSAKIFEFEGPQRYKFLLALTFPRIAKLLRIHLTHEKVDKFFRNLTQETVAYREENNIIRTDFMHLLIQLKNKGYLEDDERNEGSPKRKRITTKLTMNELTAQAVIFFAAGFETSSTAMTWCFFELSQNENIQQKLREEILNTLKEYNGKITYDALTKMNYLDCVLNESLRKYPPFLFLKRLATKEYTLPESSIVLEKGTSVFIPTYAFHWDSEYYPNPDVFDPDRFTEENKKTRPEYTWLPFGDGPRVCIGLRFAMLQMKVGICQLLMRYKFALHSKTRIPVDIDPFKIVASAKGDIWLNAETY